MVGSNRNLLFWGSIFRGHVSFFRGRVSFREGMLISFSSAIGKGDYVSDILFFPGIFSRHFHANQTHFNHNSGVLLQANKKIQGVMKSSRLKSSLKRWRFGDLMIFFSNWVIFRFKLWNFRGVKEISRDTLAHLSCAPPPSKKQYKRSYAKNHGISKQMVWRSQTPAMNIQNPLSS